MNAFRCGRIVVDEAPLPCELLVDFGAFGSLVLDDIQYFSFSLFSFLIYLARASSDSFNVVSHFLKCSSSWNVHPIQGGSYLKLSFSHSMECSTSSAVA